MRSLPLCRVPAPGVLQVPRYTPVGSGWPPSGVLHWHVPGHAGGLPGSSCSLEHALTPAPGKCHAAGHSPSPTLQSNCGPAPQDAAARGPPALWALRSCQGAISILGLEKLPDLPHWVNGLSLALAWTGEPLQASGPLDLHLQMAARCEAHSKQLGHK